MALNTKMANASLNAEANAFAALANSGKLRIYDGVQPATADTPLGLQVQLAELTLSSTAFGAAVNGVLTANAVTADSDADATGTATWFRLFKSDGTTPLMDGSVGTSSSNLLLGSTSIQQHAVVSLSSFLHTVAK